MAKPRSRYFVSEKENGRFRLYDTSGAEITTGESKESVMDSGKDYFSGNVEIFVKDHNGEIVEQYLGIGVFDEEKYIFRKM